MYLSLSLLLLLRSRNVWRSIPDATFPTVKVAPPPSLWASPSQIRLSPLVHILAQPLSVQDSYWLANSFVFCAQRLLLFVYLLSHFWVAFCLCVKTSLRAKPFINCRLIFHANHAHFHMKGFAWGLVLKQRHELTQALSTSPRRNKKTVFSRWRRINSASTLRLDNVKTQQSRDREIAWISWRHRFRNAPFSTTDQQVKWFYLSNQLITYQSSSFLVLLIIFFPVFTNVSLTDWQVNDERESYWYCPR